MPKLSFLTRNLALMFQYITEAESPIRRSWQRVLREMALLLDWVAPFGSRPRHCLIGHDKSWEKSPII